jgi:hypothetical protein
MVICDDHKRIRYLNIGWPGSVHDQRIYQNCKINKTPAQFFSSQEYLLGDSAFTSNAWMVPAYKRFGGQIVLAPGQIFFNNLLSAYLLSAYLLSAAWCKVEHTIGIWKARFPFLRQLRNQIIGKKSMKEVINFVKASAVLHNLFVCKHAVPKSWLSMDDLVEPDFDDDLDENLYLSHRVEEGVPMMQHVGKKSTII